MWREPRPNISYQEGFYLFGGIDEKNVLHNDLWLIRPDYYYNRDLLSIGECAFVGDHNLGLVV